MHPRTRRKTNKEQLTAAAALALFVLALYGVARSGPAKLQPGAPHTMQAAPADAPAQRRELDDTMAARSLAGIRENPFAPVNLTPTVHVADRKPAGEPATDALPVPPDTQPEIAAPKKAFPPVDPTTKLVFAGVIVTNEKTVALIVEKDGTKRWELRVGDYIPEHACTITRIDKQTITLTDDQQNQFVLKDAHLAEASAAIGKAPPKPTPN
jgi:hypothetical protein